MEENTLEIRDLCTAFPTEHGVSLPVNEVSLTVRKGAVAGIVGESGCGKSMTAKSVMGLVRNPGRIVSGSVRLCGRELTTLPEKEYCALRGSELSMIFQEPMTSLNPVMTIGRQVAETVLLHEQVSREEAERRALAALEAVEIPEARKRLRSYPHELSGGLRQRVLIAMAMICRPKLLIADEPTTALDVTVAAQILRLMKGLRNAGTSILIISHNLGDIAQLCDEVYVMYAGRIVESAETAELFDHPLHPYTQGLLGASSALRRGEEPLATIAGVVPNLLHLPAGCAFSLRCDRCGAFGGRCEREQPRMTEVSPGHFVRCPAAEKDAGKTPGEEAAT